MPFWLMVNNAGTSSQDVVYRIGNNGVSTASFSTAFTGVLNGSVGLGFDGTHLWYSNNSTLTIYQITTTGSVVSSFAYPAALSTGGFVGFAWDGTHLWGVDFGGSGDIYRVTTAGAVDRSFASPISAPTGITWDGTHLLVAKSLNNIRKLDPVTGAVAGTISLSTLDTPRNIAHDGVNLWGIETFAPWTLYKIDDAGATSDHASVDWVNAAGGSIWGLAAEDVQPSVGHINLRINQRVV